jgi:hypothetical protein
VFRAFIPEFDLNQQVKVEWQTEWKIEAIFVLNAYNQSLQQRRILL